MTDQTGSSGSTLKKKPREIELKIVYLKISNIETIKEEYTADVFLSARWREAALDSTNKDKINWEAYFDPKLNIQNNIGELKQTIWRELEPVAGLGTYVVESRRVKGKFFEKLELEDFPFDIQKLSILVTSELPPTDVKLVEAKAPSSVNVDSFVDQQEWELYNFVAREERMTANEYSSIKFKRPGVLFHCCAVRKAGYFIWNIMLIIAMIASLSFATFSVDRRLPQNRLQLSFTLVLTMVTFKFVASQSVPKLSYLTYLDLYILLSMAFLFLVCCWHSVVYLFRYDDTLAGAMDYYAFFGFIGLYLLGQVTYILVVAIRFFVKKSYNETCEQEFQKKLDDLPPEEREHYRHRRRKKPVRYRMRVIPA